MRAMTTLLSLRTSTESAEMELELPDPLEPEAPKAEGSSRPSEPELSFYEPAEPDLPVYIEEEETVEVAALDKVGRDSMPENLIITLEPTEPQPPPEPDQETAETLADETTTASVETTVVVTTETEVATTEVEETTVETETTEIATTMVEEEPLLVEEATVETVVTETIAAARTPLAELLTPESYFVQLAAYSSRNLAEKLVRDLEKTYTVAILPASSRSRLVYKVLVGPLNQDESGTLLFNFRSRGFKDAFIRYVD